MSKIIVLLLCAVLFLSCAKPTDPESLYHSAGYTIVGRLNTAGYAEDVEVKDTLAYIAQGEGGLAVVSIADRSHPRLLSTLLQGVRGTSHRLALNNTAVYIAANTMGLSVVDVSDPLAPTSPYSGGLDVKPAQSVCVTQSFAFVAIGEVGVKIMEILSPTFLDYRATMVAPGYAIGLAATPDTSCLLVACGEMGMAILDIHDMQGGFGHYPQIGWTDTPGYATSVAIDPDRRVAFVTCGTAGVYAIDFSDTTSADTIRCRVIGSYATGGYAKDVVYQNNRIYVATELRGLQILSVADPASLQLVGSIPTSFALGVTVDDHYVYVADEDGGLIIVAIPPY